MFRKMKPVFAAVLCLLMLAACSDEKKGNETEKPTPGETELIEEMTESEFAKKLEKSRELRQLLQPAVATSETGTAPEAIESDRIDYAYGIIKENPLTVTTVDLTTRKPISDQEPWNANLQKLITVSGLKDKSVCAKINSRIETVTRVLADPDYIPNVSGIISILEKRGEPERRIDSDVRYNRNGMLSVCTTATWSWSEEKTFEKYEDTGTYWDQIDWPRDDDRFNVYYEDLEVEEYTGETQCKIRYEITERVGMAFNLVTGKELSLSDFFPKEETYRDYLKKQLTDNGRYSFWFDDYVYREDGTLSSPFRYGNPYEAFREYDGGILFSGLGESEPFYFDGGIMSGQLRFPHVINGGECYANLKKPIPQLDQGKDIYEEDRTYYFCPFGTLMAKADEFDRPKGFHQIGDLPVKMKDGQGTDATMHIFMPDEFEWSSDVLKTEEEVVTEPLSDERVLELVRQGLECQYDNDRTPDGAFRRKILYGDNCDFYFRSATYWPNGYTYLAWTVYDLVDSNSWSLLFWVKDGKVIPETEIWDVPLEDLLAEMLTGLHTDKKTVITAENARTIAQLLAPYAYAAEINLASWSYKREESLKWDWYDFSFPFTDYTFDVNTDLPESLRSGLPKEMIESIARSEAEETLYLEDPLVYWRHLLIFQGYPFPEK